MNNYQDQWGRFHHKPVTEKNPVPSNNSWLYTAYAKKAGVTLDTNRLENCWQLCWENQEHFATRSPGKFVPPFSRDEILGAVEIGVLQPVWLVAYNWNFSPYPIPKFNLITLIKQLWQLRPTLSVSGPGETEFGLVWKHRNYFWQNNLDQLYRFAFSVPLVDRHFILKQWGKFNLFYWAISKIDSLGGKSGIRYLKYGKDFETMAKEFPADHPINLR